MTTSIKSSNTHFPGFSNTGLILDVQKICIEFLSFVELLKFNQDQEVRQNPDLF